MSNNELKSLENFVVGNADLEKLERQISKFNIFEALGVTRQELRHSDFLAFILDPSRKHGLGDYVIKNILKEVLSGNSVDSVVNAIEIDVMDLDGLEVRREWRNLDILLIDKSNELVIVVENKVGSDENENQLRTYSNRVEELYPNFHKIKIFLTPEGREANQDKDWLAYSYEAIERQLEKVIESKSNVIGQEILSLITHYNEMLRRYIVPDSDIIELCHKIYKNHKEALDLIFENKPDLQLGLSEYLKEKIDNDNRLIKDGSSKTYIRFSLPTWDNYKVQSEGDGWTDTGKILLFEFKNRVNSLSLTLVIGPGPDKIRESLYQTALKNNDKLQMPRKSFTSKFTQIYKRQVLPKKDLAEPDYDEFCKKINKFLDKELNSILKTIEPIFEDTLKTLSTK